MYGKFTKISKRIDYISFDLFDTLLIRNFEKPADNFTLIEKLLKNIFKGTEKIFHGK